MISLVEADLFFATHPLRDQYLTFDKSTRYSAIATAERDVCAALKCTSLTPQKEENALPSICEQALFLLLNPEYLAGQSTLDGGNLSPRAASLLSAMSETSESENARTYRFSRG